MPDPVVLCDANVFYSILLTDLILSLGEAGLLRPRWTQAIYAEWIRNVLADQPERTREDLERRRAFMDQVIDYDLIKEEAAAAHDLASATPRETCSPRHSWLRESAARGGLRQV